MNSIILENKEIFFYYDYMDKITHDDLNKKVSEKLYLEIVKAQMENNFKSVTFNRTPIKVVGQVEPFNVSEPEETIYFKYSNIDLVKQSIPEQYLWLIDKILSYRWPNYWKYTSLDFFIKKVKKGECTSNTVWHWDGRDYNFQKPDRYTLFHTTVESKTKFIIDKQIWLYNDKIEKGKAVKEGFNPELTKMEQLKQFQIQEVEPYTFVQYDSLNLHRAQRASDDCVRLFLRMCESDHIQPRL